MGVKVKVFVKGMLQNNIFILYDEEKKDAAIIDIPEFKKNDDVDTFIKENKLNMKYVILTHGHGDHIGGVKNLISEYKEAKLVACEDEKEIIEVEKNNYTKDIFKEGFTLTPDIYVKDKDTIKINDDIVLKVIATPGHTPGGICLYLEKSETLKMEKPILFSGDTLFFNSCGRADLFGGNWETLVKSIREKLYVLPKDTVVYTGHGEKTEIGYEISNNPYVGLDFDYSGE